MLQIPLPSSSQFNLYSNERTDDRIAGLPWISISNISITFLIVAALDSEVRFVLSFVSHFFSRIDGVASTKRGTGTFLCGANQCQSDPLPSVTCCC